jgi:hypothetical protein
MLRAKKGENTNRVQCFFSKLWMSSIDEHVKVISYYFFYILSGVRLSPLGTAATTGLLYQPQMIDDGDCGATGGMKIGRGNRSTRRKPVPVPPFPTQTPHDLTRARTRAAAVGSRWLNMALCYVLVTIVSVISPSAHYYVHAISFPPPTTNLWTDRLNSILRHKLNWPFHTDASNKSLLQIYKLHFTAVWVP